MKKGGNSLLIEFQFEFLNFAYWFKYWKTQVQAVLMKMV